MNKLCKDDKILLTFEFSLNVVSIVLTRNWNCCERCDVGVVEVIAGVVGVVEVVVGPGFMSLFMFEVLYI